MNRPAHPGRRRTILRVLVASPGDVRSERDSLPEVIDELNRGLADHLGFRLELWRWETDSYPGFHPDGPQGGIDQLAQIEETAVVIGIFWKRFGTPTHDAKSGTEHELRKAWNAWRTQGRPQVMVYFRQSPYSPRSPAELDQWKSVLEFQAQFPKEGLWWSYRGPKEFSRLVRNHLTQYLRSLAPDGEDEGQGRALEDQALASRYALVTQLSARLERVMTNLNRIRSGQPPPAGFIRQNELVPLTEIFEDLVVHRLALGERLHELLNQKAQLALRAANVRTIDEWQEVVQEWVGLQARIRSAVGSSVELPSSDP